MDRGTEYKGETQKKILNTAGEIFAEKGFRDTTIREICKKAKVNLAAIHYHFRDKENLYMEVIRHGRDVAFEKFPIDYGSKPSDPVELRLKAFVLSFMCRLFTEGKASWFGRLMVREFAEPTKALDTFVNEGIRPIYFIFSSMIMEVLGSKADMKTALMCAASIVGQCAFYFYAQPVLRGLQVLEKFDKEEIEMVAEHVVRFSLNGMRNMVRNERE